MRYRRRHQRGVRWVGSCRGSESRERGDRAAVAGATFGGWGEGKERKFLSVTTDGRYPHFVNFVSLGTDGREFKIKLEVDTDPAPSFFTETKFLLQPIPFSVKAYALPSLFAGKMHAVLCRGWGTRVKGRDWYDLVWFVGRSTRQDLTHLEARMRQSGHYGGNTPLEEAAFRKMLAGRIESLDIDRARTDIERFLTDPSATNVWSHRFFSAVADRISIHK